MIQFPMAEDSRIFIWHNSQKLFLDINKNMRIYVYQYEWNPNSTFKARGNLFDIVVNCNAFKVYLKHLSIKKNVFLKMITKMMVSNRGVWEHLFYRINYSFCWFHFFSVRFCLSLLFFTSARKKNILLTFCTLFALKMFLNFTHFKIEDNLNKCSKILCACESQSWYQAYIYI